MASNMTHARQPNLKFMTMKNLITLSAFFTAFFTIGQSENLVQYQIVANEPVKSFYGSAITHPKIEDWSPGNIESITGKTINLLLATDADYKFIINNNLIEVKGTEIAAYAREKEE